MKKIKSKTIYAILLLLGVVFISGYFLIPSEEDFVPKEKEFCAYTSDKDGYILWSDSCKLNWNNFKRVIEDSTSYYKAKTITEIGVEHFETSNDSIVYFVRTYFKEKKSYKTNDLNLGNALLKHEQLHFDISELGARKIRKEYNSYLSKDGSFYITNKFINSAFNKCISEIDVLDSLYDEETNHGSNYKEQAKWNKKVAKMLNKYKEYANPRVVMKRKLSQEYLNLGKDKSDE
tara:strand:+ start:12654 stop:13352 length:699 start_codon:yes stop_codon:yes gene_type:complete